MNFDSIVAASDFTAQSAHVLERAALLARQHQVPLRLIHLVARANTFFADPIARMGLRSRQLARRHDITVHVIDQSASLGAVLTEACVSSLLVMGALPQRSWKRFHRGSTLDHAVHGSACPLLVVKLASVKPYERVLVAIDLSPNSKSLIDFASRFSANSALKLFHAIDTIEDSKLRSVGVSPETTQANRFGSRRHARDRLEQLIGADDPLPGASHRHPLAFDVGHGDPAQLTARHQLSTQADLVVIGRRHRSTLAQIFTRSAAQRLAECATGDVLIVPLDPASLAAATDNPF